MGGGRYELEVRQHLNGPKKYCVPGRAPDTADTLESDGLIKQHSKNIVVLKPNDLRVITWQLGANEYCRAHGMPLPFPNLADVQVTEVHEGDGGAA
jgi:hypothetical protein